MKAIQERMDRAVRVFAPLWKPIDERLNPILVKEVRQALRGKYFSIVFSSVISIAMIIACMLLVKQGLYPTRDGGMMFFVFMYGCLSVAVHFFVPFSSFLSVGAEWDENTYDLLVLSNLRPRHIIAGKLLSALVQILLFYAAFGPFLVFGFVLHGLDLVGAGWLLGGTLLTSLGLSCVAMCLSSLVQQRFARVILMAVLAAILVGACGMSFGLSSVVFEERLIHSPEFLQIAGMFVSVVLTVAAFAAVVAATRFTHAEENRSTPLRVLTSIVVVIGLGWTAYMYRLTGQVEVIYVLSTMLMVGLTAISVIFCSEPESLGRHVRRQVPQSPIKALLVAPFLPGGGRGVLFYWLHAALLIAQVLVLPRFFGHTPKTHNMAIPLGLMAYLMVYALAPTLLFSRLSRELRWRVLARILVPLTAVLSFVVPTVVGFLLGSDMREEHIGNPVWTIQEAAEHGRNMPLGIVVVVALLFCALNLPRIGRGYLELGACRVERMRRSSGGSARTGTGGGDSDAVART